MMSVRHPAKYNAKFISIFARLLAGSRCILDPMAGTGERLDELQPHLPDTLIMGIELEREWIKSELVQRGNALHLPFWEDAFDGILVSPAYGNRMADKLLLPKPTWKKLHHYNTYANCLGRNLSDSNGAALQWGKTYREFHYRAWEESRRVLKNGGRFVLNVKNHIRNGVEQGVAEWHVCVLQSLGFKLEEYVRAIVPGLREGENYGSRLPIEYIALFRLSK